MYWWQNLATDGQSRAPSLCTWLCCVITQKGKLLAHHPKQVENSLRLQTPFYIQYSTCQPERNWDFAKTFVFNLSLRSSLICSLWRMNHEILTYAFTKSEHPHRSKNIKVLSFLVYFTFKYMTIYLKKIEIV